MSATADQSKYLNGAPVGPGQAVYLGLRNGFRWRGRASRSAYWWFSLFLVVLFVAFEVIGDFIASSTGSRGHSAALVPTLFLFPIILLTFYTILASHALLVRRLHDTNRSGWWQFIQLVPFAGPIILQSYLCREGTPGVNHFGDGPGSATKLPSYPFGYGADSWDAGPPGSPSLPAGRAAPPPMPADQPRVVLMSPPELPRRPKKRLFLTVGIGTAIWALPLALIVAFVIVPSSARPTSAVPAAASAVAPVPSAQPPTPASTAPAPPNRTEQWMTGLQSLSMDMNDAMGPAGQVTAASLRSEARMLSRCSAELSVLGPPPGQLRQVYREASQACGHFEHGAACYASAARAFSTSYAANAPGAKFPRLLNCGDAAVNRGESLIVTATADGSFIAPS